MIEEYSYHLLFSVPVGRLSAGDVLLASAEFEITSSYSFAIGIGSFVILVKRNQSIVDAIYDGKYVCAPLGENIIDVIQHHLLTTRAGGFQASVEEEGGEYVVYFVGYAQSDARRPGDKVVVEPNGQLSVTLLSH